MDTSNQQYIVFRKDGKIRYFYLLLMSMVLIIVMIMPPYFSTKAAPLLTIETITWNVIGLDGQDVTQGPNQFFVGARVCNSGDSQATNVRANFTWNSTNPFINLVGPSTLIASSLPATVCHDFYFSIVVTRNSSAIGTDRAYQITVSADGLSDVSTPSNRRISVQSLVKQENNDIGIITGPTSVNVGSSYQYELTQSILPEQQQLVHFINFPNNLFEIDSVIATYSIPQGANNDLLYADACDWDNDPTSATYLSCLGTGTVGGIITLTYTVKVISPGTATLNTTIYGYNQGIYAYQSDPSPSSLTVSATSTTTVTPTATATLTGTPPTSTATATATVTGTPPTATFTVTGTPPTPTVTGTIIPNVGITKSVSPTTARVGQTFTFTIQVTNTGTAPGTNASVTDTFSSALTVTSVNTTRGTFTVNTATQTVTVNLGTLMPNDSITITINTRVNANITTTTTLSNSATVAFQFGGANISRTSNSVSFVVQVTSTLPGTGYLEATPPDNGLTKAVISTSVILAVLGAASLIYGVISRHQSPSWASWFIKIGLIFVISAGIFGIGGSLLFNSSIAEEPSTDVQDDLIAVSNNPSPDTADSAGWEFPPTPTVPETLPDYPIPTPVLGTPLPPGSSPPDTSPIERIVIPALDVDTIVKYVPFNGLTWLIGGLKQEVAWMGNTSWPGLGSNTGLAGHVTLQDGSEGPFRYLDQLQNGDPVILYTEKNIYTYHVREQAIVEDADLSVIQPSSLAKLTLVTCTDYNRDIQYYLKRLIVYSDLVNVRPILNETQGN